LSENLFFAYIYGFESLSLSYFTTVLNSLTLRGEYTQYLEYYSQ